MQADSYAMELVRYIHLNPVRPRKKSDPVSPESMGRLQAYEWSSHQDYLGRRKEKKLDVSIDWLSFWHREKATARREYVKFIGAAFRGNIVAPWENLKGGLVLGDETLWEKAKELIGRKEAKDSVHWTGRARLTEIQGKVEKWVAEEKDERMRIWIRVQLGGERITAVAREFGYSDASGVHRVVQRLNKRAETDKPLKARMLRLLKTANP